MSTILSEPLPDEHDLSWLVLTFMQLKETEQFRSMSSRHNKTNKNCAYIEEMCDCDHYCMQVEDNMEKMSKEFYNYGRTVPKIWRRIEDELVILEENYEFSVVFETYTQILELHVKYRVMLDRRCFRALLYCTRPSVLQALFDKNLIDTRDKEHLTVFFNINDTFFQNASLRILTISRNLGNLLTTYTILLNKNVTHKVSSFQMIQVLMKLALIFNQTHFSGNNMRTNPIQAFKLLIQAAILNGFFGRVELGEFLGSTSGIAPVRAANLDEEDSDSMMDSDEDDEEDEFNFEEIMGRRLELRRANANLNLHAQQENAVPAAVAVLEKKTIGERIGILMSGIFPLTLKDLTRIQIKKSMKDYGVKSVAKLEILPKMLQEFVLFKAENNACLRLAEDSKVTAKP